MWIMTECGFLLNTDNVTAIYWIANERSESTGVVLYDLLARAGETDVSILEDADVNETEREEIQMRLWLAIQQGGMFTATDLYRKK